MNIKNFAVGVIAILALLVGGYGAFREIPESTSVPYVTTDPKSPDLGAMIETVQRWFTKGIRMGEGNTSTAYNSFEGTIKGTANQAFVRNTTGRTVYVRSAIIALIPTAAGTNYASSTFSALIASSTTSSIANDYTSPAGVLLQGTIATGTRATDMASVIGASTTPVFALNNGQYMVVQLQSRYACGTAIKSAMNTHACDTASSTNRGFDLYYQIPFSYSPN